MSRTTQALRKAQGLNFSYHESSFCTKVPNCPYMHLPCIKYNSVFKNGVCQSHGNGCSKSVRCGWLPSWVSNGHRLAVLRGGHLRV
jgi:hypothetical protein